MISKREIRRRAILDLAHSCSFDELHARQVAKIAGMLFDGLQSLHKLKGNERFWLECAALLHDIGWIGGGKGHHKRSLSIIRDSVNLPFGYRRRLMVGSIARYHRRALPDLKHRHYFVLSPHDRRIVRILSAILRLADGFDSAHRQVVKHVSCKTTPDEIIVRFRADRPAPTELKAATVKSDLMKSAFKRKVSLQRDI